MIFDIEQGKESLADGESVEGSDQREGITGSASHNLHKAWISSYLEKGHTFQKIIIGEEDHSGLIASLEALGI